MQIICNAIVGNVAKREKVCEDIRQLGGEPLSVLDMVYLKYNGDKNTIDEFVRIFKQFNHHNIIIYS